jgi:hypothetical protein
MVDPSVQAARQPTRRAFVDARIGTGSSSKARRSTAADSTKRYYSPCFGQYARLLQGERVMAFNAPAPARRGDLAGFSVYSEWTNF